MLACIAPKSMKKGSILYSFEGVSYDDGSSTVDAHEWHVRSIQQKPTTINLRGTALLDHSRKATFVNLVTWLSLRVMILNLIVILATG
jgi:citrate synthase